MWSDRGSERVIEVMNYFSSNDVPVLINKLLLWHWFPRNVSRVLTLKSRSYKNTIYSDKHTHTLQSFHLILFTQHQQGFWLLHACKRRDWLIWCFVCWEQTSMVSIYCTCDHHHKPAGKPAKREEKICSVITFETLAQCFSILLWRNKTTTGDKTSNTGNGWPIRIATPGKKPGFPNSNNEKNCFKFPKIFSMD